MLYIDQIKSLFRQLMPQGRAFKGPVNGYMDKLNNALAIYEAKAFTDALSTFDSAIPDNINGDFTHADATDWERRLGLIQYSPDAYSTVTRPFPLPPIQVPTQPPLPVRLQAIQQQYNYPDNIFPRGYWLYIQQQLRLAGFDVYLYENRFFISGSWQTKTPLQIIGGGSSNELADHELADAQLGGAYNNIIANHVEPILDSTFNPGANLRSTFFIGGPTLGSWAYVPLIQQYQFRQLLLKLKPTQTIGFLFVIYT